MQFSKSLHESNWYVRILNSIKIVIILFVSIYLLANFWPYYDGHDSLLYGVSAVSLAHGNFGITNDFIKDYDGPPFIPKQWVKTIHDTAIPIGNPGIYGLATISYLIGGYYGLFYLGPIFTILLLISSERIATKLFGSLAGLVTLVLLATDSMIQLVGRQLLTDNIFAFFLILGLYYLIEFLHKRRDRLILYSSIFFAVGTFFRMNGVIFFPIEILIVVGYFTFQKITQEKDLNIKNITHLGSYTFLKTIRKQLFKISIFLFIPWLVFFLFFFSFNLFYFSDPFTNYREQVAIQQSFEGNPASNFFKFNSDRFEWIKFYSVGLLPDIFQSFLLDISSTDVSHFLDKNWLSIFSTLILISALAISLYYKEKRGEIIIFNLFIMGTLVFYSGISPLSVPIQNADPSRDLQERYMIHASVLSFMLLGFIINRIWKIKPSEILKIRIKLPSNSFKVCFLILLASFLIASFYYSLVVSPMKQVFTYNDPMSFAGRYPLDKEGLSENSIIMLTPRRAVDYGAIPFDTNVGYTKNGLNPERINQEHIQMLKKTLEDGYQVYTFKKQEIGVPQFFRYLEAEHGMILKDHSKHFCKLELIKNLSETIIEKNRKSDPVCYSAGGILYN